MINTASNLSSSAGSTTQLFAAVYDQLRQIARRRMAQEAVDSTIQATALVHEAFLKMRQGNSSSDRWPNESFFVAAAADSMRKVLIDRARRRKSQKRGGDYRRLDLTEACCVTEMPDDQLLAIDEALTRFAVKYPVEAQLVRLRFFGGLSLTESADVLKISRATASRYWSYARAWLFTELTDSS